MAHQSSAETRESKARTDFDYETLRVWQALGEEFRCRPQFAPGRSKQTIFTQYRIQRESIDSDRPSRRLHGQDPKAQLLRIRRKVAPVTAVVFDECARP